MEMVNNYICDICGMNCGFLWVMSHPIINGYSELRMKLGMSYWAIDLLDLWRKGNRQPIFGQTYGDPWDRVSLFSGSHGYCFYAWIQQPNSQIVFVCSFVSCFLSLFAKSEIWDVDKNMMYLDRTYHPIHGGSVFTRCWSRSVILWLLINRGIAPLKQPTDKLYNLPPKKNYVCQGSGSKHNGTD